MKHSYEQTKMIFEIDKLNHLIRISGSVYSETKTSIKEGVKIITVHKIEDISAWFDDGEDVDLDSSFLDKDVFIEKAKLCLTAEFLDC